MKKKREKPEEETWSKFKNDLSLSDEQLEKFKIYAETLIEWNETHNLTALKTLPAIINQHFTDSLKISDFIDLKDIKTVADVGTGAGFPGIPIKIIFPHLNLLLIEVSQKKQRFLSEVIDKLELENIEICPLDWRTFLRTTEGEIDLFLSKAALQDVELARLFRNNCAYKSKQLVFWASEEWEPDPKVERYIKKIEEYRFKRRIRKLVFMKACKEK